ncbi:MAG: hypothetical protein HWN68_13970 [Desulfobacterales bacterium]|nr:hypothetical protein [Desulfobacterales bacterium]
MWKVYRLIFGASYSAAGNWRIPPRLYVEAKPTNKLFRARTEQEAMKKARLFLEKAEIHGQFAVMEER